MASSKQMQRAAAAVVVLLSVIPPASAQEVVRRWGRATVVADASQAYPGGVLVVGLRSLRSAGGTFAIFEGRRAPFFGSARGPRALVPIPVRTPPGTGQLGLELVARRGRQRLVMDFPIADRSYPSRTRNIPEQLRPILSRPESVRDGRRLLSMVRTVTPAAHWNGPFQPPATVPPSDSFGEHVSYLGGSPVEMMMDGTFGERHRGRDYALASGSLVQAPAAGMVLFARGLSLTGQTLVLDHGQGVVSVLSHMSRIDVKEGDWVEGRTPVGLSGETGLALFPHLHWGVYLHGIAVDPRVFETIGR
jgi:hypothetical protein